MTTLETQLLAMLKENARISIEDMAKATGSDEKKIAKTLDNLEKSATIIQYTAIIDPEKADTAHSAIQALVELKVQPQKNTGYDAIAKRITKYPQVQGHYLISGAYDFLVIVEGKSHHDIAAFVFDKLATLEHVTSTHTHFIFKKYKEHGVLIDKEEDVKRVAISA